MNCVESRRGEQEAAHYAAFQISQRAASILYFLGGRERIENVSQFHPILTGKQKSE